MKNFFAVFLLAVCTFLASCDSTSTPTYPNNPSNPNNPTQGGDTINVTGNLSGYTSGVARAEMYYMHIPLDIKTLAGTGSVSTTGAFSLP